jgi:hypothetical protein
MGCCFSSSTATMPGPALSKPPLSDSTNGRFYDIHSLTLPRSLSRYNIERSVIMLVVEILLTLFICLFRHSDHCPTAVIRAPPSTLPTDSFIAAELNTYPDSMIDNIWAQQPQPDSNQNIWIQSTMMAGKKSFSFWDMMWGPASTTPLTNSSSSKLGENNVGNIWSQASHLNCDETTVYAWSQSSAQSGAQPPMSTQQNVMAEPLLSMVNEEQNEKDEPKDIEPLRYAMHVQ